jgi:hypothetical protein
MSDVDELKQFAAPHAERLDVEPPGGRVRCWATGLSATERRPLLLVTGGIVNTRNAGRRSLSSTSRSVT